MSGSFNVVIPARYGSSRLPGKPLAEIGGEPMIVRVAERAARAGAEEIVVATDDERVLAAVEARGFNARMTRPDHPSGSDRVMEVAQSLGWPDDTVVINVQGDEPLIPPTVIRQVAGMLFEDPEVGVATLCDPILSLDEVFDPNVVKVVRNIDGFALYFSRAPIPYARDRFGGLDPGTGAGAVAEPGSWYRHIGVYGYRVGTLRRFVDLPVGRLERLESLEQLRLLERGIGIRVAEAVAEVPGGVDTQADLARVRLAFGHGQ